MIIKSSPDEDCLSLPVAPMTDKTQWLPKYVVARASDNTQPEPALQCPPDCNAWLRTWTATKLGRSVGNGKQEAVMSSKSVQWTIWAVLMVVFTALTLTAHWLGLALALTVTAVIWYGIVPEPRSGRQ